MLAARPEPGPKVRVRTSALVLVLLAALLGCREGGRELGNFEDEIGETGGLPPDLPAIECLPRAMGFVGDCGEGEKCRYLVDPEFGPTGRCVQLLGEGQPGDACTVSGESDTCKSGALCWAIDPATDEGVCVDYCSAFLSCSDDERACLVAEDGLLALCLERCLPIEPDACPPGWGCYDSAAGSWGCDRDYSGEGGGHGSPCECVNCCDPGLVCVSAGLVDAPECTTEGAVGCCAEVCELPEEEGQPEVVCPTENERCRAYYDDQVPNGYEQVGVCRL